MRSIFRALAVASAISSTVFAQGGPPPQVRETVGMIEQALDSRDDAKIRELIANRFTPAYKASATPEAHFARIKAIRDALGGMFAGVNIERDPEGLKMTVMGAKEVPIRLVLDDKGFIQKMELISSTPSAASAWDAMTWDNLNETFQRAASNGFSGTVLARKDGKEVARLALGKADPNSDRPNALNTVFCIGSTPIDFTITAIMMLGERGKLKLDDPISKFFRGVPADKRAMTVRHLLDSKSGLPDFFHTDADWNADLSWIDRETAVRRILSQKLKFAPGSDRAPSHTAFVLLAALVEQVSGKKYVDFLRTEIMQPVGMTRTGFYGEDLGLPLKEFAVGPGPSLVGLPNIPPNWGPTSWLIMGSGGMISTLDDMDRYYAALEAGTLARGEWAKRQQGPRTGAGGSERGYFIYRATNGSGTSIMFMMNGEGRSRETRALTRRVTQLATGR